MAEPGFQLPDLDGKPLPSRTFTSTYHDTADRRLLAAGITLRRRVESRKGLWQLKLPSADARLELESGGRELSPELVSLLAGVIRGRELQPVGVLRTQRDGRPRDTGRWSCGRDSRRRLRAREAPHDGSLRRGGDRARYRRCSTCSNCSGASYAITARRSTTAGRRSRRCCRRGCPRRRPAADAPAQAHVQAMLEAQYRSMVAHDPGVRLGDDPEDLHQLRVATRRLRAILRAARGVIDPAWADGLRNDVKPGWEPSSGPCATTTSCATASPTSGTSLDEQERKGLDVLLTHPPIARPRDARERSGRSDVERSLLHAARHDRARRRGAAFHRRRHGSWRRSQRPSFGSCAVRYARSTRTRRTRSSTPCGSVASGRDMRQSSRRPRQARLRRRFIRRAKAVSRRDRRATRTRSWPRKSCGGSPA